MDHLKEGRLLEAGCGTGNLAAQLVRNGARVEGIDLDSEMVELAIDKYRSLSGVSFQALNILNLTSVFPIGFFDGVVSFGNTLVHLDGLPQIAAFFKQVATVLKPGGHLMVQIINYDHVIAHGLKGLPTIENDHIRFERYYDIVNPSSRIDFRTVLTVKRSGQVIHNTVGLFPLRKKGIEELLTTCGFKEVSFFGDFKGASLSPHSLPLIFSARWPS
jgi:SAM-dependent methyltransferase